MWSYEARQAAVDRRIEEVRAKRDANERALVEYYDAKRRASIGLGVMTSEKKEDLRRLMERALVPSKRTTSRFESFFRTERALARDRTLQQLWKMLDSTGARPPML